MVDGRPASSVFEEKLERTVFCRVFFGWTKTEGCVMDRGIWESDKTDLSALLWGWPSKFGGVRGGCGMQDSRDNLWIVRSELERGGSDKLIFNRRQQERLFLEK